LEFSVEFSVVWNSALLLSCAVCAVCALHRLCRAPFGRPPSN
jgi:hypothetical protein